MKKYLEIVVLKKLCDFPYAATHVARANTEFETKIVNV